MSKSVWTLPHSLEAEMSIIGATLMDEGCIDIVSERIIPEQFYHPPHQYILKAILIISHYVVFLIPRLFHYLLKFLRMTQVGVVQAFKHQLEK